MYNISSIKISLNDGVVKFANSNLMASWLVVNFNYPFVQVIRNPFLVILLQKNMGWPGDLVRKYEKKILPIC
jgi:hypothetical protein